MVIVFSFIEMPCTQCSVRVQNSDLNIPQRCLLRNSNNSVRTESFLANHSEAASFHRQLVVNAWRLQHYRQKTILRRARTEEYSRHLETCFLLQFSNFSLPWLLVIQNEHCVTISDDLLRRCTGNNRTYKFMVCPTHESGKIAIKAQQTTLTRDWTAPTVNL